jgi:glutathione synthase/RimK-type ligase-like ATP-grasp enzyme
MDDAMAAFRAMKDVIVKPLFGSNGRGIVRVSDEEIAYRVFRALELERAVYYVQETLPHEGRDLRVFVVGKKVLAAMWANRGRLVHQHRARRQGGESRDLSPTLESDEPCRG